FETVSKEEGETDSLLGSTRHPTAADARFDPLPNGFRYSFLTWHVRPNQLFNMGHLATVKPTLYSSSPIHDSVLGEKFLNSAINHASLLRREIAVATAGNCDEAPGGAPDRHSASLPSLAMITVAATNPAGPHNVVPSFRDCAGLL